MDGAHEKRYEDYAKEEKENTDNIKRAITFLEDTGRSIGCTTISSGYEILRGQTITMSFAVSPEVLHEYISQSRGQDCHIGT
jgi:hypothetical protein